MSRSEGKPPTVADSTMLDDRPQAQPKKRLDDLPTMSRERYDIAGEHARGGLGVILRAHDQHLERTVAIKEIGANADERASTRFVREALITARLQHPGIVPVYEAGRWPNGARFYAMKMVSGRTLREELKAHDDLEGRLALVPSVLAVAEAVGYAHAEGVIHRDLKPDNVMIGAFGETVVVDWGLAKDRRLGGEAPQPGLYAQTHAEATHIGAVIGTPAYMSPEQARGEDVDERADVWAIGAILYHLLAAHPPYVGAPDSVIQRVANEPAPPLADKAPGAPRDLVAIVNKAMSRDPKARYANAKELAGDLSRFLTGQLVGAREYNRLARIEHWVKQHRAPVIVAAILLAILAVTASFSIVRILEERRVAQNRSDELLLTQARSQLDRDPTAAIAWLKQYPEGGRDQEAARNIAADAMSRGIARHVWRGNPEYVFPIVLSPDGTLAAASSRDVLQIWEVSSGRRLVHIVGKPIAALAFSPDGRHLAAGGQDGSLAIMEVGAPDFRALGKVNSRIPVVAFTGDSRSIITGDQEGNVRLWPLDGSPGRQLAHHEGVALLACVVGDAVVSLGDRDFLLMRTPLGGGSPQIVAGPIEKTAAVVTLGKDGRLVYSVGERVMQWKLGATAPTDVAQHRAPVSVIAVSGTGRIASGSEDGTLIDTPPDGPARTSTGAGHRFTAIAFDPTGSTIVSGDDAGEIQRWTRTDLDHLRGHEGSIGALAVRSDGAVISSSDDRTVRWWPAPTPGRVIEVSQLDLFRVAFTSPNTMITTGRDGIVSELRLDRTVRAITQHNLAAYDLKLLPDGSVATSSWDGAISIVGPDGRERKLVHGSQIVWNIAASPDGKRLASASADGVVKLWDLSSGQARVLDKRGGEADDVAFSPDGRLVATSGDDFEIRVFDLTSNDPPRVLRGHTGDPLSLTFSADSRTLYSAGGEGVVRSWNLATGASQTFTGHDGQVRTIALSPDQRYLASGSADNLVIVWDLANAGRAITLPGHTAEVRHVAFAADSRHLASAGWDGTVRLWNLTNNAVEVWRGHQSKVHRVAFSPDGKLVASAGQDGTVRLWSIADESAITLDPGQRSVWEDSVTTAVIDDHQLVTSP